MSDFQLEAHHLKVSFCSMVHKHKKILYSVKEKNYTEVADQGDFRSLYFKNNVVQSRISLRQPGKLILKYTQYMMAASLLAKPQPSRILLIGVGAGSLLHFIHAYLPAAHVDAVDYSPDVLQIAREYFALPENEKIIIHCADGLQYLAKCSKKPSYDLILIDAFNDQGMAKNIYSHDFFKLARNRLSTNGTICCNLWSGNKRLLNNVKKIIFKNSASSLFIPVAKRENIIALLLQNSPEWQQLSPSYEILNNYSLKYQINFKEVSLSARKNNMKLSEKLSFWLN